MRHMALSITLILTACGGVEMTAGMVPDMAVDMSIQADLTVIPPDMTKLTDMACKSQDGACACRYCEKDFECVPSLCASSMGKTGRCVSNGCVWP